MLVNHNELLIIFRGSTGVMERENFSKSNTTHHKDGDQDWKQWDHRHVISSLQPRSQGLLLIQNGGSEKPLAKAAKWLQNVNYDEMSSLCLNNGFRLQENKQGCQTLETTSVKAISSCVTWQNTPRFLEYFSSLGQGFLRAAILSKEKALGTRLIVPR